MPKTLKMPGIREVTKTITYGKFHKLKKKDIDSFKKVIVRENENFIDPDFIKVEVNNDGIERDPFDILDDFKRVKDDGAIPYIEIDLSSLDKEFIDFLARNGAIPIFLNAKTSSMRLARTNDILTEDGKKHSLVYGKDENKQNLSKQFGNTYFMPVILRSLKKTNKSREVYVDKNGKEKEVITYFCSSSKKNILSVQDIMLDIDIRDDEMSYEKSLYSNYANSILYFAEEKNIPKPTAIVYSGRGLQLHFVAKEQVYLNSKKASNLIKYVHSELVKAYDNDILSEIILPDGTNPKVDKATGAISQKMRLPGTYNLKSGTKAETLYFNKDCTHVFSEILDSLIGTKEENAKDIERRRLLKEKAAEEKKNKKKSKKNLYKGQNISEESVNNRREAAAKNLNETLKNRVFDIKDSMIFAANRKPIGFRNNGYFNLILHAVYAKMPYKEIKAIILEIEENIPAPYFRNEEEIFNFYKRIKAEYYNPSFKFSNELIVEKTACVAFTLDYPEILLRTLGQVKREDIRKEQKIKKDNKIIRIMDNLSSFICRRNSDSNISKDELGSFCEENKISSKTFYHYLRIIKAIKEDVKGLINRTKENISSLKNAAISKFKHLKDELEAIGYKKVEIWYYIAKAFLLEKIEGIDSDQEDVKEMHNVENKLIPTNNEVIKNSLEKVGASKLWSLEKTRKWRAHKQGIVKEHIFNLLCFFIKDDPWAVLGKNRTWEFT